MNYRLIFIALFVPFLDYALTSGESRGEKEWQKLAIIFMENGRTEKFNEGLVHFAKKYGSSLDFKERLKSHRKHKGYTKFPDLIYIKPFALERANDQDEKKFKRELEKYKQSIPSSDQLKLLAKKLKEESKFETSSPEKRLKERSASLFLDHLAQKEGKSWFQKALVNHPYSSVAAIFMMAFYGGIKAEKAN